MRLAVELKLRRDDVCARRLPTGSKQRHRHRLQALDRRHRLR
jgi:hypothetical protein